MALQQLVSFAIRVLGDGTDRVIQAPVATAPYSFGLPAASNGTSFASHGFSLSSPLPNGVLNVVSSHAHGISASITLGIVTFTYDVGDAPPSGEVDTIYGDFSYTG